MSFGLGSAHGQIVIDYNGAGVQQAIGDLNTLAGLDTARAMQDVGRTAMGVGDQITQPFVDGFNAAADFEFQMDAVNASLGGLDGSQMEQISDQALQLGADTKYSATEIGAVQEALGKSGITMEKGLLEATEAVTNMAAATGEDLVTSGEAAAAAVNLFGLEADQIPAVADTFTAGLNNSSASLADFQRGVNNLGPVMANLAMYADDPEQAFTDTAAAVAYFNSMGLKAADAGISLARGITNLSNPTSEASALMAQLGIDAFDLEGNFIGLPALFDQLNASMAGMSDEQREAALATIFGAEAADVMNQAIKNGGDGLREYNELMESQGQAAEQAAIRQGNFQSAVEQLGGALESLGIDTMTPFLDQATNFVNVLAGVVEKLTDLPAPIQTAAAALGMVGGLFATAGGAALLFAGHIKESVVAIKAARAAMAAAGMPLGKLALGFGLLGLAIGAAVAAYQTNFLGFADFVDEQFARVTEAIDKFGAGFDAAFNRGQTAGLNDFANTVQALGDALLYATGIDITGFTDALAAGIQAFGDTAQEAYDRGLNPLTTALLGLASAANALGFDALAKQLWNAGEAVHNFAEGFEAAFTRGNEAGMSRLANAVQAFGDALLYATGIDITGFTDKLATKIDDTIQTIQEAIPVIKDGLGEALRFIGDNVLPGVGSALGNFLGTIRDVGAALAGSDFSGALDIARGALEELGGWIQGIGARLMEWINTMDVQGAIQSLSDKLGDAFNAVGDYIGDIDWSGIVSTIGTTLSAAFANAGTFLGGVASGIAAALREALGQVAGLLGQVDWNALVSNVGTALSAAFATAGTFLSGVAQGIASALREALGQVAGLVGQVDWQAVVSTVGTGLSAAFATAGTWLQSVASGIASALREALGQVATLLGQVDWAAVVSTVGTTLSAAFANAGTFLSGVASGIASALRSALAEVAGLLGQIDWNAVVSTVGTTLSAAFAQAGTWLQGVASSVGSALRSALGAIGDYLGDLDFQGLADTVFAAIASAFGTGGGQLSGSGDLTGPGNTFASISEALGSAISQAASAAGDYIKDIDASGIMTALQEAISDAITVDQGTVDFAGELGEQLGTWLGEQLSKAIQYALDSLTGGGSGGVQPGGGFHGPGGTGSLTIGDAFANFDTQFTEAIKAALEPEFEQIKAALGEWIEQKKTDLWNEIWQVLLDPTGMGQGDPNGDVARNTGNILDKAVGMIGSIFDGIPNNAFGEGTGGASAAELSDGTASALGQAFGAAIGEAMGSEEFTKGIEQALDQIPDTAFAASGQALIGKITEGMAKAIETNASQVSGSSVMSEGGGGGGTAIASLFAPMVESIATGLQQAVETIDPGVFAPAAGALTSKISEGLSMALSGGSVPGGIGPAAPEGAASIGTELVEGLAQSIAAAVEAAPTEAFTAIGAALTAKIQTALSTVMSGGSVPGGVGPAPTDGAGSLGTELVTGLATSIANAITSAPAESFAQIGTALQQKIQEALNAAMSGGGGGQLSGSGDLTGGGDMSGIGQQIVAKLAEAIGAADFAAVGTAFQTGLTTAITTAMTEVGTAIAQGVVQWMTEFSNAFTNIQTVVTNGMTTVTTAVTTGMTTAGTAITTGAGQWFAEFSNAMTNINTAVTGGMQTVQSSITTAMGTIVTDVTSKLTEMTTAFQTFATDAATAGTDAGTGFSDGLTTGLADAESAAQSSVDAIKGILEGAADTAYAAGQAVGQGFADGISSMEGAVRTAAEGLANAAAGAINAVAKISSPSKVTEESGMWFGQGFANGIQGTMAGAAQAGYSLGDSAIRSLRSTLEDRQSVGNDWMQAAASIAQSQAQYRDNLDRQNVFESEGSVWLGEQELGRVVNRTVVGGMLRAGITGGRNNAYGF